MTCWGSLKKAVVENADLDENALTVLSMDGQALDFPNETFDAVTGMSAYYNISLPAG